MKKFVLLTLILLAVTTVALGFSFERESYFENGQLSEKIGYKSGEKDGLHEMYYPDGALFLRLIIRPVSDMELRHCFRLMAESLRQKIGFSVS